MPAPQMPSPSHEVDLPPADSSFANRAPHVPPLPCRVRRGGRENSAPIWLNSKYLSRNGNGRCVAHVHLFSGCHEEDAASCDQCAQIVLAYTRANPILSIDLFYCGAPSIWPVVASVCKVNRLAAAATSSESSASRRRLTTGSTILRKTCHLRPRALLDAGIGLRRPVGPTQEDV